MLPIGLALPTHHDEVAVPRLEPVQRARRAPAPEQEPTAGGFVGPYVMGWLTDRTGSFTAGLAAMAGFLLMASALSWSLKAFVKQD